MGLPFQTKHKVTVQRKPAPPGPKPLAHLQFSFSRVESTIPLPSVAHLQRCVGSEPINEMRESHHIRGQECPNIPLAYAVAVQIYKLFHQTVLPAAAVRWLRYWKRVQSQQPQFALVPYNTANEDVLRKYHSLQVHSTKQDHHKDCTAHKLSAIKQLTLD